MVQNIHSLFHYAPSKIRNVTPKNTIFVRVLCLTPFVVFVP